MSACFPSWWRWNQIIELWGVEPCGQWRELQWGEQNNDRELGDEWRGFRQHVLLEKGWGCRLDRTETVCGDALTSRSSNCGKLRTMAKAELLCQRIDLHHKWCRRWQSKLQKQNFDATSGSEKQQLTLFMMEINSMSFVESTGSRIIKCWLLPVTELVVAVSFEHSKRLTSTRWWNNL